MKKIFKTLAIAVIALVAVFACAFAVGCTDKGNNDGNTASDYNFTILYEDGTPVNGQTDSTTDGKVWIQICMMGEGGMCVDLNFGSFQRYADKNGKLSLSQKEINDCFISQTDVTEFVFHVRNVKGCNDNVEKEVHGKGDYTITVTKA